MLRRFFRRPPPATIAELRALQLKGEALFHQLVEAAASAEDAGRAAHFIALAEETRTILIEIHRRAQNAGHQQSS